MGAFGTRPIHGKVGGSEPGPPVGDKGFRDTLGSIVDGQEYHLRTAMELGSAASQTHRSRQLRTYTSSKQSVRSGLANSIAMTRLVPEPGLEWGTEVGRFKGLMNLQNTTTVSQWRGCKALMLSEGDDAADAGIAVLWDRYDAGVPTNRLAVQFTDKTGTKSTLSATYFSGATSANVAVDFEFWIKDASTIRISLKEWGREVVAPTDYNVDATGIVSSDVYLWVSEGDSALSAGYTYAQPIEYGENLSVLAT